MYVFNARRQSRRAILQEQRRAVNVRRTSLSGTDVQGAYSCVNFESYLCKSTTSLWARYTPLLLKLLLLIVQVMMVQVSTRPV